MKIIHIISGIGGGGRERRMGQLAIDLNTQKYAEQHIIYLVKTDHDYQEIINSGICLHHIEYSSRKELSKSLMYLIESISPDIVHLWINTPIILLVTVLAKFKYRYRLIAGYLADGNKITGMLNKIAAKFVFTFSDAIISNSKAGLIAKHAPLKKSHIIYNGFDFSRFNASMEDIQAIRNSLLQKKNHAICMVARFSSAKDWDMFFNVAEQIKSTRNDVTFVAVGSGSKLVYYKNQCRNRKIDNTIFLGQRSDVECIIKACDISVLFTNSEVHAEGVSNTIMETMAAAKPIIATAGGGTAEIIEDGNNGYIINPNNTTEAINRINVLLDTPLLIEKVSSAALDTIRTKFLLADKTHEYISLYDSLSYRNNA